jgi:hypothetical protein
MDDVLSIAASAGVVIDAPSKTLKLQQGLAYARRSLWGVNGDLPMLRRDCIGRSLQPMSLQWVNRVGLALCQPLPVSPNQRTLSDRPGVSQRCQRTNPLPRERAARGAGASGTDGVIKRAG